MPVSLITGLPGSGKTAGLVKRILDLTEKEPGRPIFQMGINGLKPGMAQELTPDMLATWWELPQGSIICIDECQEEHLMPKDRGQPSAWVQKITKVRHFGMDFILTTQHPANMSAYVRRLVDMHQHNVMRAKGVCQTYVWTRCIDNPDSRAEKKFGEMSVKPLPKEVFELYKSSSLHTMKVRTPRLVWFLGALVLTGVILAFAIPWQMHRTLHPEKSVEASEALASASASDRLRSKDYVKWAQPRVAAVPWSAPMFDHLEVTAKPKLYCIAVDDGRCSCMTEQGTRYALDVKTCRAVASDGLYNPFIGEPSHGDSDGQHSGKSEGVADRREAASPLVGQQTPSSAMGGVSGASGGAAAMNVGVGPQEYQPPTYAPRDTSLLPGGGG